MTDLLAFSTYYSEYYPDKNDNDGKGQVEDGNPDYYAWQKEIVFTGRIDIIANWIFKLEYHKVNGAGQVKSIINRDGMEKDWSIFVFKSTFCF